MWRRKSDEELVDASSRITEYTEIGQRVILAELQRRRALGVINETVAADVGLAEDSNRTADRIDDAPNGVIVSLWRGDVPLRKTYWVCGVLTNLFWIVLIALAEAANMQQVALLLVMLNLIYSVFIIVAIWRSASRYRGNRFWADLARFSIVLGLIRTVANLFFRS